MAYPIIQVLIAIIACPLLLSVIRRVKAFFGGRKGPKLLQIYYDLYKLLRKAPVYSRTTSWVFRASPSISMAAVLATLAVVPLAGLSALCPFSGDMIFLAYTFGLMRFFTVLAALDTGSPFEGMGASREVQFSALAEMALIAGLVALAVQYNATSLTTIFGTAWTDGRLSGNEAPLILVASTFMLVLLAENARIPFDDPTTHLELTMVHEVMILDHCGVDLAMIEYASAMKLWVWISLFVSAALPIRTGNPALDMAAGLGGMLAVAIVIGAIESIMARLRLVRVPQLLVVACVLSLLAVGIGVR
jgi:formate hydrogenlyase subunit 4